MRVESFSVGPLGNNTYILLDERSGDAILIDPSFESRPIWESITSNGWFIRLIVNTHAHIDHVVENAFFAEMTGAPIAMHADDLPLLHGMDMQAAWMGIEPPPVVEPSQLLVHGGEIALGQESLRVVLTPGHSPGSISLIGEGFVISGDVLFAGSIGRSDLPGGDHAVLIRSIQSELLPLPDATVVYPGHGSSTTIGRERRSNPFLAN